jgi:1-acyl-sn-glycerol-3-phosphate acyltransferase
MRSRAGPKSRREEFTLIVQTIRSLLFYGIYLTQTVIVAIIVGTVAMFVPRRTRFSWALIEYWCASNSFLMRWIAGVRTEVNGAENIPPGGCIIASKHQSDWDIFAIFPHTERPAYIVKKELMDIPFFGHAARALECIAVDRKKGGDAMPALMADAKGAISRGCRIVIFPEGTRKAPLADPDYRFGVARMYAALNVPVVPVALNSGLYWGRNSLILWPGTAKAEFLPPILPGLTPEEFLNQLRDAIETRSNALIAEAIDAGISAPVSEDMRERLDRVRPPTSGAE